MFLKPLSFSFSFSFLFIFTLSSVNSEFKWNGYIDKFAGDYYYHWHANQNYCYVFGINDFCRNYIRLDTIRGCFNNSNSVIKTNQTAPNQRSCLKSDVSHNFPYSLDVFIVYYYNCTMACKISEISSQYSRSDVQKWISTISSRYALHLKPTTPMSSSVELSTIPSTTQITTVKSFGVTHLDPAPTPHFSARTLLSTNLSNVILDSFVGDTNIPDSTQLINDPGPVSDKRARVYLKGYHVLKTGDVSLWYLIAEPSRWEYFSGTESVSKSSKSFPLHNSSHHLTFYNFQMKNLDANSVLKFKYPNFTESLVKVTEGEANGGCISKNSIIEEYEVSSEPGYNHRNFLVCFNGTILETVTTMERVNCTTIFLNKIYQKCEHAKASCVFEDYHRAKGQKFVLNLEVKGKGIVKASSDVETKKIFCKGECSIEIKAIEEVKLTCPDETVRIFNIIDDLTKECPMISYWLTSRVAASICRMTFDAKLFGWLILWIFIGYKLLTIIQDALDVSIHLSTNCYGKCKSRMGANYDYCPECYTRYEYSSLLENHETCVKCTCPYCRETLRSKEELVNHSVDCKKRVAKIEEARKREMKDWKTERSLEATRRYIYNNSLKKFTYFLVIIIMFYFCINPVKAFEPVSDDWETFKQEIEDCGTNCWRTSNACECPKKEMKNVRVILSNNESPISTVSGYMDINGTFSITESQKIVDLTFTTSVKTDRNVLVSGNSIVDLPLEIGTGLTWRINNADSKERKTLSIGVYSAAQIYSTIFKYYTSDRTIIKGQQFECVYSCKDNCNCPSKTCKVRKYLKDRAWNCNPTWCLSWGAGCTCCHLSADISNAKYVYGIYDSQYEKTDMVLCLNYDHPKYTCFNINEGGTFQIENFKIKVTKVFGIDKKLPKKIACVYNKHESSFDPENPDTLLLDPEIKNPNSVVHGDIGDFSFVSWAEFLKHPKNAEFSMSWSGVSIDRSCSTGSLPICNYYGVTEEMTAIFENMIQTSEELRTNFKIKSLKTDPSNNDLLLKILPKKGAGLIQLTMSVKNLELKRSTHSPVINIFKIMRCEGCRGCHSGFWCLIKLSLAKPDRFSLHLKSATSDISVETNNLLVFNYVTSFNVSLFSSVITSSLSICIEETSVCSSYDKLNLSEPIKLLSSKRESIMINTRETKRDNIGFFNSIWLGLKKFGLGIWDFMKSIFRNLWFALILIIIIILIILLSCTKFGRMLFCFFPFRLITFLKRREKIVENANKIQTVNSEKIKQGRKEQEKREKEKRNNIRVNNDDETKNMLKEMKEGTFSYSEFINKYN